MVIPLYSQTYSYRLYTDYNGDSIKPSIRRYQMNFIKIIKVLQPRVIWLVNFDGAKKKKKKY